MLYHKLICKISWTIFFVEWMFCFDMFFFSWMGNSNKVPNLICDPCENMWKLASTSTGKSYRELAWRPLYHFSTCGVLLFILCEPYENICCMNIARLEKLNLMSLCNRYIHTLLAISFVLKCLYGKYDVDPFEYISLNSRHKNTLKFCHTYAQTESFKYTDTVLIDFLRILISFLKIFVINFFLLSQGF